MKIWVCPLNDGKINKIYPLKKKRKKKNLQALILNTNNT